MERQMRQKSDLWVNWDVPHSHGPCREFLNRGTITGTHTHVSKNVQRIDPKNDLENDLKNVPRIDPRNDLEIILKNVPRIDPKNNLENDLKNVPSILGTFLGSILGTFFET